MAHMGNKIMDFLANTLKIKRTGRKNIQPKKDSINYPFLQGYGGQFLNSRQTRPTTYNLRLFSRTPYVRRAIHALQKPIILNKWEIVPTKGIKLNSALKKQIEIATHCFSHPNHDNSFASLLELIIEDWAIFGAGCIEQQLGSDPLRPLWLWPVDAQSIFVYPAWSGKANEARYVQLIGVNNFAISLGEGINLRNDELLYIRANAANDTPYGYGPVQIAYDAISRLLGTGQYAGNKASNAQPQSILCLNGYDDAAIRAFRAYWRNEVEGQGVTPIIGANDAPTAIQLHSGTDDALYLKYQEFLIREIATAFDLSPQNLGIERDVNRSQGEVAADRDWEQAIKPLAALLQSYFTREIVHAKLGWYHIEFKFIGLDREDEESTTKIFETRYKNNSMTPNEYRARRGEPPMNNMWGNLTYADYQIAVDAARGAKQVDDPSLKSHPDAQSNTDPTNSKLDDLKKNQKSVL